MSFSHDALFLKGEKTLVYTAFSKHYFYFRMHISEYVLKQDKVPLNPFMIFDYFLLDTVDRDRVREANNTLLLRSDEVFVFGPVSNGVLAEILLAKKAKKPIHYFEIEHSKKIIPICYKEAKMEEEVAEHFSLL